MWIGWQCMSKKSSTRDTIITSGTSVSRKKALSPCRANYAGTPIGQLIYFTIQGEVEIPYSKKRSAKYRKRTVRPVEFMMWKNFR